MIIKIKIVPAKSRILEDRQPGETGSHEQVSQLAVASGN